MNLRKISFILTLIAAPISSFEQPTTSVIRRSNKHHAFVTTNNHRPKRNNNKALSLLRAGSQSINEERPPSQFESILANAKTLNPFGRKASPEQRETVVSSLAAGLAVSLAMVPEAISFAYVAGVSPLVGLWTTVSLGLVAASFGGRAGICSSASGACSVVVASLCAMHGPAYLSACAIMAGFLQVLFGGFGGVGKFIRLVPHPVMLGFVNGLTVVMFKAQLNHFKSAGGGFLSLTSTAGKSMYGLTALTMLLVRAIPKINILNKIPPSLGAVTCVSVLAKLLKIPATTLADVSGKETFRGGLSVLPKLSLPSVPFSLETLQIVAPFAITMAAVGTIESLLTMQLLDGIEDDGKRGSTKKECIGQGLGNIASGLVGGIGGCALLGQSIINMESGGGKSKLSGMSMALFLALGIVAGAPLLGNVPIAALTGVMFAVCQSTFSWSSLRILNKIPKLDAMIIFLVSFITVKDDLAKAVVAGVIASALGFAWKQSTSITSSETYVDMPFAEIDDSGFKAESTRWKSYRINGPLFFGSTTQFGTLFNVKNDPSNVIIDFTNSRVYDHSALEAINDIVIKYRGTGRKVHLRHLSNDCKILLNRLHGEELLIESDPNTDPVYAVTDNIVE